MVAIKSLFLVFMVLFVFGVQSGVPFNNGKNPRPTPPYQCRLGPVVYCKSPDLIKLCNKRDECMKWNGAGTNDLLGPQPPRHHRRH